MVAHVCERLVTIMSSAANFIYVVLSLPEHTMCSMNVFAMRNKLVFLLQKIDASAIEDFYGLTSDIQKSSETGYILFYQSRDASC